MTSTRRLVDTSRNPLARELLRSAELDEPPEHSVVRLALALGLGSSAVVSTIATGASASAVGAAATGAGTALGAHVTTGAAVSGVAASNAAAGTFVVSGVANVAAGTAALASGTGVAAAGAAAPVVGSALSAVGMLKAMAIVSLTCGALSFGGTKLAMTITDAPASAASVGTSAQRAPAAQAKSTQRARAAEARITEGAPLPPPPAASDEDDDVVPTLGQALQPENVRGNDPRQVAFERNVGRQNIDQDNLGTLANNDSDPRQRSLATAELTTAPATVALNQAAVAAFPSDDQPPPIVTAPPGKVAKAHAKAAVAEPESDRGLEIVLLDRARNAVAAGQPLVALQALELYRTQAPRGVLRAESVVLRIQALLALGQYSAAERIAIPFIKAAPLSSQAARIRGLLGIPTEIH